MVKKARIHQLVHQWFEYSSRAEKKTCRFKSLQVFIAPVFIVLQQTGYKLQDTVFSQNQWYLNHRGLFCNLLCKDKHLKKTDALKSSKMPSSHLLYSALEPVHASTCLSKYFPLHVNSCWAKCNYSPFKAALTGIPTLKSTFQFLRHMTGFF